MCLQQNQSQNPSIDLIFITNILNRYLDRIICSSICNLINAIPLFVYVSSSGLSLGSKLLSAYNICTKRYTRPPLRLSRMQFNNDKGLRFWFINVAGRLCGWWIAVCLYLLKWKWLIIVSLLINTLIWCNVGRVIQIAYVC